MDGHPLSGALEIWEGVVEDAAATAAALREEGWEALELHPGDVTPLPPPTATDGGDGEFGLDVLVPGDEFDAVASFVGETSFDEYEVYRAREGGVVFLLLVMKAAASKRAVLVPLYYAVHDARPMLDRAREEGRMRTVVRPLSDDRRVVFTQEEPARLFPD
ncbi:DUF7529 family protein [Halegenticoccus soli]|uniref:DUF7529 family protein n=1 Tax=Halegenticoccus soli TaxID=1985678 RepID=UPI000C6DF1A6|nr:hypothetical protein [Halegenticoccus soli]